MKRVPVSENGHRLGDHHHRVVVPDAAVAAMLRMQIDGMGWRRIARAFPEYSAETIKKILQAKRRNVTPAQWKEE